MARGANVVFVMSLLTAAATITAFLLIPEEMLAWFLAADDPDRVQIITIGAALFAAAALFHCIAFVVLPITLRSKPYIEPSAY